jgi:hypothetical protein
MKKFILVLFCLILNSAMVHADELSIKITLGIRENNQFIPITNRLEYPLAFQIENTGKTVITKDRIPDLFFNGILHIMPKDGQSQQCKVQRTWRTGVRDLKPGDSFVSSVYGDLLTFFPSTKDGDYQVWWTEGDLKSNVLRFTVTDGKLSNK